MEYSPDSSHIFLGVSQQRRLLGFGGEYAHRLFLNRWAGLHWLIQVRPVFLESDPVLLGYRSDSPPLVILFPQTPRVVYVSHSPVLADPQNVLVTPFYGRQWTYSGGANPIGLKLNGFPHRRLQPVFAVAVGFLLSSRDLPVDNTSAFNFCAEYGPGLEWFLSPRRSLRFDYRYHHISNANLGAHNPATDSGILQITYSFGH